MALTDQILKNEKYGHVKSHAMQSANVFPTRHASGKVMWLKTQQLSGFNSQSELAWLLQITGRNLDQSEDESMKV